MNPMNSIRAPVEIAADRGRRSAGLLAVKW
jgi:hypothetical protein